MPSLPYIPARFSAAYDVHREALRSQSPLAAPTLPWQERRRQDQAWREWWRVLFKAPTARTEADRVEELSGAHATLLAALPAPFLYRTSAESSEAEWRSPLALALVKAEDGDGIDEGWHESLRAFAHALFQPDPGAPAVVWRDDEGEVPVGIQALLMRLWSTSVDEKSRREARRAFENDAFWGPGRDQALDLALWDLNLGFNSEGDRAVVRGLAATGAIPSPSALDHLKNLSQKNSKLELDDVLRDMRTRRLEQEMPTSPLKGRGPRL